MYCEEAERRLFPSLFALDVVEELKEEETGVTDDEGMAEVTLEGVGNDDTE